MRIPINLASQPFRRDRAVVIGLSAVAVLLVITLGILGSIIRMDMHNKRLSARDLAVAQRQLDQVLREQRRVDAELHKPQNAAILERSVLLNDILMRKGISWTRIFSDLEKVLPYNVRINQIRPQVDSKNHIFLQMIVGADSPEPVLDFLAKLEGSDVFGSTMVYNIVPPSQTDPMYRYNVSVNYVQKI